MKLFLFRSMKTLRSINCIGLLLFVFFFSCQRTVPQIKSDEFVVDSLFDLSSDSIDFNPFYSREQLNKAISITEDSLRYYQVYAALISSYMRTGEYDTAKRMIPRLLYFCNKEPIDSFSHSLFADAYNFWAFIMPYA